MGNMAAPAAITATSWVYILGISPRNAIINTAVTPMNPAPSTIEIHAEV